mmetsp:Transcript_63830/g.183348  ORF Transcript_63830/g.183348 Transcript_63830/m.183348 type:complete len:203 (-) Transcript_63830:270-878(-)
MCDVRSIVAPDHETASPPVEQHHGVEQLPKPCLCNLRARDEPSDIGDEQRDHHLLLRRSLDVVHDDVEPLAPESFNRLAILALFGEPTQNQSTLLQSAITGQVVLRADRVVVRVFFRSWVRQQIFDIPTSPRVVVLLHGPGARVAPLVLLANLPGELGRQAGGEPEVVLGELIRIALHLPRQLIHLRPELVGSHLPRLSSKR